MRRSIEVFVTVPLSIFLGFDPREADAFAVARHSIRRQLSAPVKIYGLVLSDLKRRGLYTRPTEKRKSACDGDITWDLISDAPQSTEFANSRFLVKELAGSGWALFMDCDVLVRCNLMELFRLADPRFAVMCVKHKHVPPVGVKMDGQVQTRYARKNWTSVMLMNCDHVANNALTVDLINNAPGRDLHAFTWLADCDIGTLGPEWNWLVGEQPEPKNVKIIHWTKGGPWFKGYEDAPYADEWRREQEMWAA